MSMEMRRRAPTARDVVEQLLDSYQSAGGAGRGESWGGGGHQVPLNAWETKDGYHVVMLAPGADPNEINVTAVGGTLTVEGELRAEGPQGANSIWTEFGPSRFRRTIQLPDAINTERVQASYRDGLLEIEIPKAEHAKPRSIQVRAGGGSGRPADAESGGEQG